MRVIEAVWNTYIGIPLRGTLGPSYWGSACKYAAHAPEQYRHLDEAGRVFVEAILNQTVTTDAVLDVGCGPHGRHLRALWRRGYRRLTGVDVDGPESKYFRSHRETFQRFLPACKDQSYEAVVSYGATLELIPPQFPVVAHLCRIASKVIVLMLHERGHAYPRLWRKEFEWAGWRVVEAQTPIIAGAQESLLVLRPK